MTMIKKPQYTIIMFHFPWTPNKRSFLNDNVYYYTKKGLAKNHGDITFFIGNKERHNTSRKKGEAEKSNIFF